MHIYDLKKSKLNLGLAYTLGLMYPLYKETNFNQREYILGCINHNPGKVTQDEINIHFRDVYNLLKKSMDENTPKLIANKTAEYIISRKDGFTILLDKTYVSMDESIEIMTNKVKEILLSSEGIRKEFVKGCFDGRSSIDKTAHYLSIDVDRVYERQDLVVDIIESLDIKVNVNRREMSYAKNDQIRIKTESLKQFLKTIGLYSACRKKLLEEEIG